MPAEMTTYRLPQPAPTEPGWYYADGCGTLIEPVRVVTTRRPGELIAVDGIAEMYLSAFVWYGPVPICKEG